MSGAHRDIGPELRQIAQLICDRLEPAVRAAAALAADRGAPGRCQQTWCPVCALAALVTGEQHPMLTLIAEHSVALLAVVRAMVDTTAPAGEQKPPPGEGDGPGAASVHPPPGRYQHIPITTED